MYLYAATIFTSSFLLFLVQPLIARQILPWFGGSAAVWATCLVFFQCLLFAGYAYADWTTRRLGPRRQEALHLVLLAASLAFLPIIPAAGWKPVGAEDPVWRILGLLGATIGLPYFLLSTTGPLVQAWFARAFPAGTVYRLFALSNFASLLALLAYPVLVEPWLATPDQARLWSGAYVLFVALCSLAAALGLRRRPGGDGTAALAPEPPPDNAGGPPPGPGEYGAWLLFAAMGSFMLLAVTNHLTHDLASVPFLWVLPLAIYLITFIICFGGRAPYQRRSFVWLVFLAVAAMAWQLNARAPATLVAIPLAMAGLFVMCMFFHGELAERKPAPRHLTRFYLMVSLGGALGGMAVGLGAPQLLAGYYELGLGLLATLALAAWVVRRLFPLLPAAALGALAFSAWNVHGYTDYLQRNSQTMARNFYGTLRVVAVDGANPAAARLRLMHGSTIHGEQFLDGRRRDDPTTYYGPTSGIGRAIWAMALPGRRIGVVGLGTGTLAAYGRPGDLFRFYEINPLVMDLARRQFSFLGDSGARIEEVPGDARLALEREAPQNYDVLAIDAFSSDSIPVHLMTREALRIYLRHVKPGGIIAFHVSNRYLDLAPVVGRLAADQGLAAVQVDDTATEPRLFSSDWVLVARDPKVLAGPTLAGATGPIKDIPGLALWTDDFNNLFQVLK